MERVEALKQIVTFGPNKEQAFSELAKFGYDSETELFEVTKAIFTEVLNMYISEQITSEELEEWANFVECRDDLNYEIIEGYIYSLANPYLAGNITKVKINNMVKVLNTS